MRAQDQALIALARQRGLLGQDPKRSTRSLVAAGQLTSEQVHLLLRDLNRYLYVCPACRLELSFNALEGLDALRCYQCQQPLAAEERSETIPAELYDSAIQPPSKTLGPYSLIEELGHGSYGGVYLGKRSGLERLFAIKVLRGSDPEALARFKLETAVASKIHHPNVVGVYDAGRDGNHYYYVMEYCPGQTLSERLRRGPLPYREAADLVRHLALGVEAAHAAGVLHRDLKPANVILARGSGLPRITDFGLARDPTLLTSLTQSGDTVGTPYYMSPEQLIGDKEHTDERSDVFALGVVLFECLTGQLPVTAQDMNDLAKQLLNGRIRTPRQVDPSLPAALDQICQGALQAHPIDRTPSAEALALQLSAFLNDAPIPASARLAWPPAALVTVGLLALAVGVLLPLTIVGFTRAPQEPADVAAAPQASETPTPAPTRTSPRPLPSLPPSPSPSPSAAPVLLLGPEHPRGSAERVRERNTLVDVYMQDPTDERMAIKDRRVLAAMRRVPRHAFLAPELARFAYVDAPMRHYRNQKVSQPHLIALMTELLQLEPDHKVLEVGTGSGYHAAVLHHLCRDVFSLELDEELANRAARTLRAQGYRRVRIRCQDGYDGWPDEAPFDAILLTASAPSVPRKLWDQLEVGGRLVLPHGPKNQPQQLTVVTKQPDGKPKLRRVLSVRFSPLTGKFQRSARPTERKTERKSD